MQKLLILIAVVIVLSLSTLAAEPAKAVTVEVSATTQKVSIEASAKNAVDYQLKCLVKALIKQKRFAEAVYIGETNGVNVVEAGMTTAQIASGLAAIEAEWREQDREDMAAFRLWKSTNPIKRQKALEAGYRLLSHMSISNNVRAMLPDDELPPAIITKPKKTK